MLSKLKAKKAQQTYKTERSKQDKHRKCRHLLTEKNLRKSRLRFFFVQDGNTAEEHGSILTYGDKTKHSNDGCSGFEPDSQLLTRLTTFQTASLRIFDLRQYRKMYILPLIL